ncbi:YbaK/EbsC family protein [Pallidibacillus thermolactis]|jgi:prolyl-tRNA editing enzyme YbaK/EbsC (Cys-tRNA(Pro) deacylase)|uniref:YbaK/EbsC family protein n=1 Tax=Pallidibacillus thermolactis TaxID=251051 RepID=UPI0021D842A0|nr:YbaK/EbsC family protein [Pallidibacillus thermolactis]MCU9601477.1 YbaK/EbsC family protein [Pallidibacillus thermolactis subsp. kokeshiiformis]MED1673569.1 YbaK/EbsC family protein [Pallidibacillus thermolactis subsp. kokeshiiformis]
MSLESVKAHLKKWNRDQDIMIFNKSSATVEQAATAIGVEPERIAKTLSFRGKDDKAILVVTAGDAKVDNKKFRHTFGYKARMLRADEVVEQTGHVVGGVCPFGLANELEVYLDVSLNRFETVFPACGSINSAIEVTCSQLEEYSGAKAWIDVCKLSDETKHSQAVEVKN